MPELEAFSQQLQGTGERTNSTTMAFVRILRIWFVTRTSASESFPSCRMRLEPSGWKACFVSWGYTPRPASSTNPRIPVRLLRIVNPGWPGSGGGHQRSGRFLSLAFGRDFVQYPPLHTDSILHLLLHVRIPAHWRPGLGGGDMQARGFLLGGTAGRTTLNGEGLQHQDGHSHVLASTIPTALRTTPVTPMSLR